MALNPLRFLDPNYDPVADLARPPEDPLARLKRLGLLPDDKPPQPGPAFPAFKTDAEADSAISGLLGTTMGGLQLAASALDKPGRAVRGVLGGKPRELLNLVPFSDTIGLTNPADNTSGRDLLEKAGVLAPNQEGFDAGDVAGFAADVLLDPTLYVGLGGLTQAGKAAAKAGRVARASGQAGQHALTGARQLAQEAVAAGKLAPTVESGIRAGQKGLFDVGVPFVKSLQTTLGTGERAAEFAGKYVDPLLDKLKYGNPIGRTVGKLFNPETGSMGTELGQKLYAEQYAPAVRSATLDATLPLQKELRSAQKAGLLDEDGIRAMRAGGEIPDMGGQTPAQFFAAKGDTKLADAAQIGEGLKARMAPMVDEAQKRGIDLHDLADDFIDYLPRYHHPDQWAGVTGKLTDIFRRKRDMFNPGRLDFLKGFAGGTNQINDLIHNTTVWNAPFKDAVFEVASHLPAGAPEEAAQQAQKVVSWIRSLDQEKYLAGGANFFNADPISDAIIRAGRHAKQITQADFLHEMAHRSATKIVGQIPTGYVPLTQALQEGGLKFNQIVKDEAGNVIDSIGANAEAARRVGLNPTDVVPTKTVVNGQFKTGHAIRDLDKYFVPAEIADDMKRFAQTWKSPSELTDVLAGYDKLLNLWKASSTQVWPGFHSRNVVSGLYYHLASGAGKPGAGFLQPFHDAYHLLMGQPLGTALPAGMNSADDLVSELGATGILKQGAQAAADPSTSPLAQAVTTPRLVPSSPQAFGASVAVGVAPVGRAAKGIVSAPGIRGKFSAAEDTVLAALDAGRKVGNFTEDLMRVGHYLAQRHNGLAPLEAAASVKKWFFDYGELTQFEKNVMKRTLPFYTFARNNIPLVLNELLTKPGGAIGQTIRAANAPRQNGGFVPSYVSEGLAVKIPGGEGARYLTGLGLPVESAFDPFSVGPTPTATVQRNLEGVIAQSNPLAKYAYTAASGRDPFSGRNLTDLYKSPTSSIGVNALANSFLGTPISRARGLLDERKGVGAKALNFLTGARVTDIAGGEDRARELAARKINERILSESPQVRSFTDYHVPADQRQFVTPEIEAHMRLEAWLTQHARDVKKKQGAIGAGKL